MPRGRPRKQKEPAIGHNGGPLSVERKRQLSGYITEIERWEAERAEIAGDVKTIFDSAKDAGFDTKAMRRVIKDRKKSKDEREAFEMRDLRARPRHARRSAARPGRDGAGSGRQAGTNPTGRPEQR